MTINNQAGIIIPLTRGYYTIIDAEDIDKVLKHSWVASLTTYNSYRAEATINNKRVRLHRFIMNAPKGTDIHHINGNTLDNRKYNLVICSRSYNLRNRKDQNKFTGIYKQANKWCARTSINNKTKFIGSYKTKDKAIQARKEFINELR